MGGEPKVSLSLKPLKFQYITSEMHAKFGNYPDQKFDFYTPIQKKTQIQVRHPALGEVGTNTRLPSILVFLGNLYKREKFVLKMHLSMLTFHFYISSLASQHCLPASNA